MFYVANSESFISHKNAINKRRILCDAVEDAKDKPLLLLCVGGYGGRSPSSVVVLVVGILPVAHLQHRVFIAQTMQRMLCKDIRDGLRRGWERTWKLWKRGLTNKAAPRPQLLYISQPFSFDCWLKIKREPHRDQETKDYFVDLLPNEN